ncbi:hypothetical protein M758_UG083100 [Ceratodon purpureus]|nr:hypothetical protein M758_UG083100 [Ceratodon purpureus]
MGGGSYLPPHCLTSKSPRHLSLAQDPRISIGLQTSHVGVVDSISCEPRAKFGALNTALGVSRTSRRGADALSYYIFMHIIRSGLLFWNHKYINKDD